MPLKRSNRARGFTLIELLVVVAIIALLISILLPSLSQARKQAKRVVCGTRLKDIGVSLMSYSVDFDRFPLQNTGPVEIPREDRTAHAMWGLGTHEYIADQMGGLEYDRVTGEPIRQHPVFYCPEAPPERGHYANNLSGPGTDFGIQTVEEPYIHITYQYYGRLDEFENDPATKPTFPQWENEDWFVRRSKYVDKEANADEVLMADSVAWWPGALPGSSTTGYWRVNHHSGRGGWQQVGEQTSISNPPDIEGANQMFGDGHVEWQRDSYFDYVTNPSDPLWRPSITYQMNADGYIHWW
jgi:prepilin-type N-terminal cleavage/methylation domain-containing protein/prepilin-type processing-associated H-X9-DG protein